MHKLDENVAITGNEWRGEDGPVEFAPVKGEVARGEAEASEPAALRGGLLCALVPEAPSNVTNPNAFESNCGDVVNLR